MQIGLGIGVTRLGVNETITGLWSFANVLGLLVDDIGERTPNLGVAVDGLVIKDSGIPEAAVTAHEAALAILMSQITGNIPDAQVPQSAVTQHQAALSIAGTQIPSLPAALVTAHEAALAILESQIADGTILARLAAIEAITARWTFQAGASFNDGLDIEGLASASAQALFSAVTGDSIARFFVAADGKLEWGSGAAGRDTNLYRRIADVLKTDDSFEVGAALRPLASLQFSQQTLTPSADIDDVSTGGVVMQRIAATGATGISGFVAGGSGSLLVVMVTNAQAITLNHQDAGSSATNRIITPTELNMGLGEGDAAILLYDAISDRWRVVSSTLVA